MNAYRVNCQCKSVRFEMEITQLENIDTIYCVRFKKISGDTWPFKDITSKVLSSLDL